MAGTFTKIYYHIVFSTKGREQLISPQIEDELYKYITGIISSEEGFVYAIGGTSDHLHILCSFSCKKSISEMLQRIKGHSSKWMNSKQGNGKLFKWQSGYGLFTVSHSQIDQVKKYVANQHIHHKTMSFKDELRILLNKHEVEFDEKYIWQ